MRWEHRDQEQPCQRPRVARIAEGGRGERGRCKDRDKIPATRPWTGFGSPGGEGAVNFGQRNFYRCVDRPWGLGRPRHCHNVTVQLRC